MNAVNQAHKENGDFAEIHGLRKTRLYNIWCKMRYRCHSQSDNSYKYYGDRGITVCKEWRHSLNSFYDWAMENGYSDNLTLERIDNNGDYKPSNCRWATRKEQANNFRANVLLTVNGMTYTMSQWGDIVGLNPKTISGRIRNGWPIDEAILTPKMTLSDAAKRRNKGFRRVNRRGMV